MLPDNTFAPTSLRERKKAKTRAAIQQQALRLFHERGYEATTVEQIAEAAEVSPSTFFRYFPTKEDVVMWDDIDPLLFAAYDAQPAALGPIQALRGSMREVFAHLPAELVAQQWERSRLIFSVPELRMRMLDQFTDVTVLMAELIAKRVERRADDFAVRTFAGAVSGVLFAAILSGTQDPDADLIGLLDSSLAFLEAGMPI